jgi:hypothetical protein
VARPRLAVRDLATTFREGDREAAAGFGIAAKIVPALGIKPLEMRRLRWRPESRTS